MLGDNGSDSTSDFCAESKRGGSTYLHETPARGSSPVTFRGGGSEDALHQSEKRTEQRRAFQHDEQNYQRKIG